MSVIYNIVENISRPSTDPLIFYCCVTKNRSWNLIYQAIVLQVGCLVLHVWIVCSCTYKAKTQTRKSTLSLSLLNVLLQIPISLREDTVTLGWGERASVMFHLLSLDLTSHQSVPLFIVLATQASLLFPGKGFYLMSLRHYNSHVCL